MKCQVTGKKPVAGRQYSKRGIAKKLGGIGLRTTGKTKRYFMPNVHKKRLWFAPENRWITLKLSTEALRTIDKKGLPAVVKELRAKGQKI